MPVQEADELDPFSGSVISGEEAASENGRTQTHTRDVSGGGGGRKKKKKEMYICPLLQVVMLVIDD